jgi:hypothetical protein
MMQNRAKGLVGGLIFFTLLALFIRPAHLGAVDKKLRIAAESAPIYLQPDGSSAVIDTLERGSVLSLLSSRRIRKNWYYVCFKSEKTGATKSGYVLDSAVELLFDTLRSVTIAEESSDLGSNTRPNFEEMEWG